jgi:hypothetical protein
MQVTAADTIPIQITDTIQDTIVKADYFIGNVIPLDSAGKSFPDTISTTDGAFANVYLHYDRAPGDPIPEKSFNSDFGFGILTFSLIILALITILGRRLLINSLSSLSFKRPPSSKPQTAIGVLSWAPLLTNLFSLLNISLFIALGAVTTGIISELPGYETIKITGIIFGGFVIAILLRHLICTITGGLSGQKEVFREYLSVIYALWFLVGLTFFILSILILFTRMQQPEILVWIGAGIFVLLFFYRIIRLLIIFLKRHVPFLYFILYLCALEVLPVLIIIKLLNVF